MCLCCWLVGDARKVPFLTRVARIEFQSCTHQPMDLEQLEGLQVAREPCTMENLSTIEYSSAFFSTSIAKISYYRKVQFVCNVDLRETKICKWVWHIKVLYLWLSLFHVCPTIFVSLHINWYTPRSFQVSRPSAQLHIDVTTPYCEKS